MTLVDSETISARIFQQMVAELGFEMDYEIAVEQFAGASMNENLQFVTDNIDGDLPAGFEMEFRKRTYEAFKKDLKPIEKLFKNYPIILLCVFFTYTALNFP